MKHANEWIECEECGGSGNDPGGLSAYGKTDCPECCGYGKVQAPDNFFVEEMECEGEAA